MLIDKFNDYLTFIKSYYLVLVDMINDFVTLLKSSYLILIDNLNDLILYDLLFYLCQILTIIIITNIVIIIILIIITHNINSFFKSIGSYINIFIIININKINIIFIYFPLIILFINFIFNFIFNIISNDYSFYLDYNIIKINSRYLNFDSNLNTLNGGNLSDYNSNRKISINLILDININIDAPSTRSSSSQSPTSPREDASSVPRSTSTNQLLPPDSKLINDLPSTSKIDINKMSRSISIRSLPTMSNVEIPVIHISPSLPCTSRGLEVPLVSESSSIASSVTSRISVENFVSTDDSGISGCSQENRQSSNRRNRRLDSGLKK